MMAGGGWEEKRERRADGGHPQRETASPADPASEYTKDSEGSLVRASFVRGSQGGASS